MAAIDLGVAALVGALAGLGAGEASRALAAGRGRPRRPDLLSWTLAASGALAVALHAAVRATVPAVVEAGAVGLVLLVLASDLRERTVYPAVVYSGVALAAIGGPSLGTAVPDALLGAVASFGFFAVLYVLARVRYGPGALGDGDVSVAALLGAVAGLGRLPLALALAAVIGAGMALAVGLRARSLHASFPYAPALCVAALLTPLLDGRP